MGVKICHASISENGNAGWDGKAKAGDQTEREVCERTWYNKPWDIRLRYSDAAVAKKAAAIAQKLASSNLVGYDQSQRNTLYQELKKNGFDVDKYIKSGVKTETDCSAFVYACYACVIPAMRSDSNAPVTSNMRTKYKAWGFTVSTDMAEANIKTGDVFVKESAHTVMAVTPGKTEVAPGPKTVEQIADEVIAGKWGSGPDRKSKLEAAGYNYDAVQAAVNAKLGKKTTSTKKTYSGAFPVLPSKGFLGLNDSSTQVKALQLFLQWYGGYGLTGTGFFGSKTLTAVKAFQKAEGLTVDGKFGPKSLEKAKTIKK